MTEIHLFDSHCHLDFSQFDDDREQAIVRMQQAGVRQAMLVATELGHISRLTQLAEAHDGFYFSVGLHPNHAVEHEPDQATLAQLANHSLCRAIGETGMDFFRDHVTPDIQQRRFRIHIQAAQQLGLPVIIHMRDADEDCLSILEEHAIDGKINGIMHCFSSTMPYAERALALDMDISFSGNVTYKRNMELREVAANVPAEHLLLETDAPFLAPVPHRGKRNEPAYVYHVAECLAEVRQQSLLDIATQCTNNACRRFAIEQ